MSAVQTVPVRKAVRFFRIRMLFLVLGERVLAVILKRKVLPDKVGPAQISLQFGDHVALGRKTQDIGWYTDARQERNVFETRVENIGTTNTESCMGCD